MSWETYKVNSVSCPCGNGKVVQELKIDDWNRHIENIPKIQCDKCLNKYDIEEECFNPKPYHDYTIYYCVDKLDKNVKIKLDL